MRRVKKLTARRVSAISKPGKYGDGLGLWLNVRPSGTRTWFFRFMRQGKAREMGLGSLHTLSLADARERALLARKQLLDGDDPIEARKEKAAATMLATASMLTFRECSVRCIDTHKITWKNAKHANQWTATLEAYVWPVFGDLLRLFYHVQIATTAIMLNPNVAMRNFWPWLWFSENSSARMSITAMYKNVPAANASKMASK